MSNPDEAAARGLWSDPQFLEHVAELNPQAKHTQFADFHGHGWVFRAVFKKDRKGNLLDHRRPRASPTSTTEQLMAAIDMPDSSRSSIAPDERRTARPMPTATACRCT